MMRATGMALVLLLAGGAAAVRAAGETTVILVRHAEKAGQDCDTATLTKPQGHDRAKALAPVVERAGVSVAIHSKCLRTQLTLEPAIRKLGLTSAQVLVRSNPDEVVAEILGPQRGRTVLIAGHSDTIPAIVEGLGAPPLCPPIEKEGGRCLIPYGEFHHLFVVTIPAEGESGRPTMVWGRYGKPSP